jgi:hypothetical protein
MQPRTTETFYLMTEHQMRENIKNMRKSLHKQARWRRFLFRFTRAMVLTDDGRHFPVELSDYIRQQFTTI